MTSLVVAEVFGPTVQGEGPSAGRRCSFVRLAGCNLHCSWCDTPYTWDASRYNLRAESERMDVDRIAARAFDGAPGLVVISGGEPLLHQGQAGWVDLLHRLDARAEIEIETNGTIAPDATSIRVARFNVSPKLSHAGDAQVARVRPVALASFARLAHAGRASFKFVVRDRADIDDAAEIVATHRIPADQVWVMPVGTTPRELIDGFGDIVEAAVEHRFNVTTRLHVLAWGDERGR